MGNVSKVKTNVRMAERPSFDRPRMGSPPKVFDKASALKTIRDNLGGHK